MKTAVLGAGAFGTALAIALHRGGAQVTLWGRDAEAVAEMQSRGRTPRLPGVTLPASLPVTGDLETVLNAEILLISVPAQKLGPFLESIPSDLAGQAVVACCKGIDLETLTGPGATIARTKPGAIPALLTGPSFAADIARGLPTALTLACADETWAIALQQSLSSAPLRLYRTLDVAGAELGGALKNVIAIACGACIGRGMGDSARAALMTRGFAEMQRLAAHLGARPETLMGLSGFGDLALTCTSELSRNFRYGLSLGRGTGFDADTTVEGAATAQALTRMAARDGLDLPICTAVDHVSGGSLSVDAALDTLLNRPLKEE